MSVRLRLEVWALDGGSERRFADVTLVGFRV